MKQLVTILLYWTGLYLNDGKGGFIKSKSLPPIFENKSCVSFADIDKDGDQDIFVGTLANARKHTAFPKHLTC